MTQFPLYRPFVSLPANTRGRDYLVGDLHGTAPLLLEKLHTLGFDFTRDRLFCTGDLVDRGPASLATLALLREPWFFSTLGNHERILLAKLGSPETAFFQGMTRLYSRWLLTMTQSDAALLRSLIHLIATQPLVLHVDHPTHPFFVTHASRLPHSAMIRDASLHHFSTLHSHSFLRTTTLSRRLAFQAIHQFIRQAGNSSSLLSRPPALPPDRLFYSEHPWEPGVGLTYVGHTVVPRVLLHRSHCFIDRGACFASRYPGRCALEIIDHQKFSVGLPTPDAFSD